MIAIMIKVPYGNKFVLHIPLFRITDQHTKFYVNVADITDLKVKRFRPFVSKEDVELITEDIIGDDGTVTITFSADLPLSRYSIVITGKDGARDISVNLLNCVEIVRWNEECNFTKYVLDTPLVPDLLTLPECFIAGKINWGFIGGDIEDQEDLMNLLDDRTLFASELDQLIATVQAHGDIEKGTTIADLTGMSFKQMVELILFPNVNPTITEPSLTLTFKESTFENGGTYLFDSTFPTTEDVTATFDSGLSVAGVVESPRAGEGTPVVTLSTDEWPLFGEVTISGDVAFEEGPVVKDSHLVAAEFDITGEELENPLPAGTLHQELKVYATVPFISNGFYGPNVEDNLVEAALYELSDEASNH